MATIDIDFEVFKQLTVLRKSEKDSYNDVIRRVLKLSTPSKPQHQDLPEEEGLVFLSKGVRFPHGTQFRAIYKGKQYTAEVVDGTLVYNGKKYKSPSAAAVAVTNNPVNGWIFWDCQFPGQSAWKTIKGLRAEKIEDQW